MAESTTPDPTLDGPTALRLLREVVAERPDYIYAHPSRACVHVYKGQPSCIAGHVLVRAGFDPATIEAKVDQYGNGAQVFADVFKGQVTENAVRILRAAQIVQDGGQTWGDALEAAESTAAALAVSA